MSDTPQSGDGERTNLAPILAPIITLFIGFGAGVVFSEFIPLGQTPTIQATGGPSSGEGSRDRGGEAITIDDETKQMLEDAAAEGDESAREALEELDQPADPTADTDVPGEG